MRIFISYRREDTSGYAGRLNEALQRQFGSRNVFMDIDSIKPGENFLTAVHAAMTDSDAILVLIGRSWLTARLENGNVRLFEADDYVRAEVASALGSGRRVIPVLVQGAKMPSHAELPPDLAALSKLNAVYLTDRRWKADVGILATAVKADARRRYIWPFGIAAALSLVVIMTIVASAGPPYPHWPPILLRSPAQSGLPNLITPTPRSSTSQVGQLTVSTHALNFGSVTIGQVSPYSVISVTNTGAGTARVQAHLLSADFAMIDQCSGVQLSPNQRCQLQIEFTPHAEAASEGAVTFSADNANTPDSVLLYGVGTRRVPHGPITGIYGLCVDDLSSVTDNGNAIIIYLCSGNPNQDWTTSPDGTLRALGKCMDISGASTADGAEIDLYDCNGGANQVWRPQPNGELLNPASGKCLEDPNSGKALTQLTLATCTNGNNQHWALPT